MQRLLALILLLALAVAAGCGDDDEKQPADDGSAPEPVPAETQPQTVEQQTTRDKYGCVEVAQPKPKQDGGEERPTEPLSGDATVTFKTNCGTFKVSISADGGLTSASFVKLAKSGFYKNTIFHRIAPGFVIQGGDPTATGTGGPGYTTKDPPPSDAQYPKYTVAMAKGPQEPDGTAGSQFFVMTGDSGLPPQYALVGKVSAGFNVIDNIGKLGDPSEQPTQIVKIEKASATGG